jgi:nitrogen fixation protein
LRGSGGRCGAFPSSRSAEIALLLALGFAVAVGAWGWDSRPRLFFYVGPVKLTGAAAGRPGRGIVPLTNITDSKIVVKAVAIEGASIALAEGVSASFKMAPGEVYDLPVTVYAKKERGIARVRIVAAKLDAATDVVEVVKFHYEIKKEKK